jgi:hypothetical protein
MAETRLGRLQFSLRTLLLLPVVVAVLSGAIVSRIHQHRQQREAVHELWHMGVETSYGIGERFSRPESGLAWIHHKHKNWLDDLLGTEQPFAVLVRKGDYYEWHYEGAGLQDFADTLRKIPSVKYVAVDETVLSDEQAERLSRELPAIQVERFTTRPDR